MELDKLRARVQKKMADYIAEQRARLNMQPNAIKIPSQQNGKLIRNAGKQSAVDSQSVSEANQSAIRDDEDIDLSEASECSGELPDEEVIGDINAVGDTSYLATNYKDASKLKNSAKNVQIKSERS